LPAWCYFDAREDIGTYDLDYNRQKIEQFKKLRDKGFFFGYLMRETFEDHWKRNYRTTSRNF
jgi:hypothetical protein